MNEYDLVNPLQDLPTIRGVSIQDKVKAIQDFDEFKQLLAALESQHYWKSLVAICVLAGPREGELLRLRFSDLKTNWFEIHSSKTDRKFRAVPLEETLLFSIVETHLTNRKHERETASSPLPLKSDLLFPSLAAPGTIERTKSKPESWSGPRAFLTAFDRAMDIAKVASCNSDKFKASGIWDFTPQIYRHTFGSILARAGRSALQISRLMGNSPTVASTHYVDQCSHGRQRETPLRPDSWRGWHYRLHNGRFPLALRLSYCDFRAVCLVFRKNRPGTFEVELFNSRARRRSGGMDYCLGFFVFVISILETLRKQGTVHRTI